MEPVLVVENLTVALPKEMDRAHAVEGISFALRPGKVLCRYRARRPERPPTT